MAKKQKFVPETQGETQVTNEAPTQEAAVPDQPKKNSLPVKPQHYLETGGVQYKFTKTPRLPKSKPAGQVKIDGVDTDYHVTSSKGYSPEGKVLYYSWFNTPAGTGYITHDYEVQPVAGVEYTFHEGKATRANPERVAAKPDVQAVRITKFKAYAETVKGMDKAARQKLKQEKDAAEKAASDAKKAAKAESKAAEQPAAQ